MHVNFGRQGFEDAELHCRYERYVVSRRTADRPARAAEKWLHAGLLSVKSYEQVHDSCLASCIALDPACGGALFAADPVRISVTNQNISFLLAGVSLKKAI